jgi:DNA-binding transcriptional LysR family regulator
MPATTRTNLYSVAAAPRNERTAARPPARVHSPVGAQSFVRRVDPLTLKLFLSAIEYGQISIAAERENIVPSAATRRIQELEELAGARLLDRSAKGVVPSPAGLVVARYAKAVIDALLGMRQEMAAFTDAKAGCVSMAVTRLLLIYFVAAEVGEFTRRFPLVDVQMREESHAATLRALTAGEVDLAVYDTSIPDTDIDGIRSVECRRERLVVLMPADHALAHTPVVSLEALLEQDLIGTRPGSCLMANLRHAAHRLGRNLRLKRSVDTIEAARSLVCAGLGLALQPESGVLAPHERERVVAVPLEGDWATLSYRVGWRAHQELAPATLALIEQLKDHRES